MSKKACFYSVSLLLVLVTIACNRSKTNIHKTPDGTDTTDTIVIPKNYNIKYTGRPFALDTIYFSTDIPEDFSFTWEIRNSNNTDVVYKKGAELAYVFSERGRYEIIATIDDNEGNVKGYSPYTHVNIGYPYILSEVYKIGTATQYWHAISVQTVANSSKSDTIMVFDDTFDVSIINDMTVAVMGHLLTATGKVIDTSGYDFYVFSDTTVGLYAWETLFYYYEIDSFRYYSHPYQGSSGGGPGVNGKSIGVSTLYYTY